MATAVYSTPRPARVFREAARSWLPAAHPFRSIELFTGGGGLALGTHLAGFQHTALVEWNADACRTLRANIAAASLPGIDRWRVIEGDARALEYAPLGPVDLVAGGAPCQPFSIGGKHRGMEDGRNMIPDFIRAVRLLAPRAFILENVRGLLRPAFAAYFSYVLLELAYPSLPRRAEEDWMAHARRLRTIHAGNAAVEPRYEVTYRLLNAADYGVPQTRTRVFIVGFRADTGLEWRFPEPTHSRDALLRAQWVMGDYWDHHGLPRPETPAEVRVQLPRLARPELWPREPWRTTRDAIADLPDPSAEHEAEGIWNHRLIPGARAYTGHTGSALDLPSKTLKAGDHGVPGGENMIALPGGSVRYLTAREAARMQTFPDAWRFEGAWTEIMRQLGNAVPMELARSVARSVAERLASFGNHDPGGDRLQGEITWWDTLHPGRPWAERLRRTRTPIQAEARVRAFLDAPPERRAERAAETVEALEAEGNA